MHISEAGSRQHILRHHGDCPNHSLQALFEEHASFKNTPSTCVRMLSTVLNIP